MGSVWSRERGLLSAERLQLMDGSKVLSRTFITLGDVQVVLSISSSQAYALVRSGQLRAIRVGGRGQWRIEVTELEAYIDRAYEATEAIISLEN